MSKFVSHALTLLGSIGQNVSDSPSYEGISDAWQAFDTLRLDLLRDGEHSMGERALVRDLEVALFDLTRAIQQQQQVPDGDQVRLVTVALQSSVTRRSLAETGELVLSEDDIASE
jgi:hypothetical protein